jgi:hypothetical protein
VALIWYPTLADWSIGRQERLTLDLTAGRMGRIQLTDWLRQHLKSLA